MEKLLINTQLQIEGDEKKKKEEEKEKEKEKKLTLKGDETPSYPKLKYSQQLHRLTSAEQLHKYEKFKICQTNKIFIFHFRKLKRNTESNRKFKFESVLEF